MRWAGVVKYESNGRPLTVITPVPGSSRARAMASLRRPVVWVSAVTMTSASRSAGLGRGQVEGFGGLGRVRMIRAGVHLQLGQHLAAERALGQHALDRAADGLRRLGGQQLAVGVRLDPARVAAVAVHAL